MKHALTARRSHKQFLQDSLQWPTQVKHALTARRSHKQFLQDSLQWPTQMKHALTERSSHKQFLQDSLQRLETIKFAGRILPCVDGWKLAINAVLLLWEKLENANVKFLLTGRLNEDAQK